MPAEFQCSLVEPSLCSADGTLSTNYSDRYDDTSAVWVMMCAILMFFMGYRTVVVDGKEAKVMFHNFPETTKNKLRKRWILAIRRDVGNYFQPGKWTKICSLHFVPKDFYNFWNSYRSLREDAVPSIFPFETVTATKSTTKSRTTRVSQGELAHETTISATECGHSSVVEGTNIEAGGNCSTQQQEEVRQVNQEVSEAREVRQLKRQLEEAKDEIAKLTSSDHAVIEAVTKLKKQLEEAKDEIEELKQRLDKVSSESAQYQKLAEKRKFGFSNIEASERDVQFYTGLPSAEVFLSIARLCKPREKAIQSRLMMVSRESKKKQAVRDEQKAGFLYMELSFSDQNGDLRRRVVLVKYVDTFASTIGFWLFGFAFSGNTSGYIAGEEQDYIFWFFRFTFASNTATILGGTLVGQNIQMRMISVFIYSFLMSSLIHPPVARWMWSTGKNEEFMWSPFRFCNGTRITERDHSFTNYTADEDFQEFIFFDFAGSGIVHLCGGMGALVLQIFHKIERKITDGSCHGCFEYQLENRRYDFEENNIQSGGTRNSSQTFLEWMYPKAGGKEYPESASLGVLILWTTWFGFNAGSTESFVGKVTHASVGRIALVMALAAASGGLTCTIISSLVRLIKNRGANTNEIANGMLACLVAVTGCCPFIDPPWAILIGVLTVFFYHFGCYIVYKFDLHDGARIFPVHGICGFWGVLCVGIFSRKCLIKEVYEITCYCKELNLPTKWETQGFRFLYQLGGGLFIATWSTLACIIMFAILWLIPIKNIMNNHFTQKYCNAERLNDFKGNMLFAHFQVPQRHTA